jgi:hypothetical protein
MGSGLDKRVEGVEARVELDLPRGFCIADVAPRGEGRNLFTLFGNATSSEYDFRFRVTTLVVA